MAIFDTWNLEGDVGKSKRYKVISMHNVKPVLLLMQFLKDKV